MDAKARLLAQNPAPLTATLAAATTLLQPGATAGSNEIVLDSDLLVLDPGGSARDVTLPGVSGMRKARLVIVNSADAAENLVVKNAAAATIITIGQGETGEVIAGADWYAIGVGTST